MYNLQASDIDFLVTFGILAALLVVGVGLAGLVYWAITGKNPFEDAPTKPHIDESQKQDFKKFSKGEDQDENPLRAIAQQRRKSKGCA